MTPTAALIAFTLTSFHPGELTRFCESRLRSGIELGFRAVTLTPSFLVEDSGEKLVASENQATLPGEVARCLSLAESMGLAVIYQPHLEGRATLENSHEFVWRANFKVSPNADYQSLVFGEWTAWVNQPRARPLTYTAVVIGSELEKSVALHSDAWLSALAELRQSTGGAGASRIRWGMNFNWEPVFFLASDQCESYAQLIGQLDFVALSLYGDFRKATKQASRFDAAIQVAKRGLIARGKPAGCSWAATDDGSLSLPLGRLAVGEFGVGGRLRKTYSEVPAPKWRRGRWIKNRRAIFHTFFNWLQTPTSEGASLEFSSLWTVGIFDPFGIHEYAQPNQVLDPEIRIPEMDDY